MIVDYKQVARDLALAALAAGVASAATIASCDATQATCATPEALFTKASAVAIGYAALRAVTGAALTWYRGTSWGYRKAS